MFYLVHLERSLIHQPQAFPAQAQGQFLAFLGHVQRAVAIVQLNVQRVGLVPARFGEGE